MELLRCQLFRKKLLQRPRGKPRSTKNAEPVKEQQAAGWSQAEVMEKQGVGEDDDASALAEEGDPAMSPASDK